VGKSKLLRIIAGVDRPLRGTAILNDLHLDRTRNHTIGKSQITYLPQDTHIFNESIFDNVSLHDERTSHDIRHVMRCLLQAKLAA